MSDLFEEDDASSVDVGDDFIDVDVEGDVDVEPEPETDVTAQNDLDARRRLENMLDEKRLRDELDDFGDY